MYRIDVLLKQNQELFHTRDLAVLWGIANPNTLYTTIKRYVARGILIPVHKGLYSVKPIDTLDPALVGLAAIHAYAYVSLETVLARHGVIFQAGDAITFVSAQSRRFSLAGQAYVVRRMPDRFIYCDTGIERSDGVLTASVPRAMADMLYINPRFHADNPDAVDWKAVRIVQKEVGYS